MSNDHFSGFSQRGETARGAHWKLLQFGEPSEPIQKKSRQRLSLGSHLKNQEIGFASATSSKANALRTLLEFLGAKLMALMLAGVGDVCSFPCLQGGMDGRKDGVGQFIRRHFSLPAPMQRRARDRPTHHGRFQLR